MAHIKSARQLSRHLLWRAKDRSFGSEAWLPWQGLGPHVSADRTAGALSAQFWAAWAQRAVGRFRARWLRQFPRARAG